MRECLRCGFIDSLYWRHSRYDFNADYCRREEFAEIEPLLSEALSDTEPLVDWPYIYYRRGTGKVWVYRVYFADFKVDCDRAYTKPRRELVPSQTKLRVEKQRKTT